MDQDQDLVLLPQDISPVVVKGEAVLQRQLAGCRMSLRTKTEVEAISLACSCSSPADVMIHQGQFLAPGDLIQLNTRQTCDIPTIPSKHLQGIQTGM